MEKLETLLKDLKERRLMTDELVNKNPILKDFNEDTVNQLFELFLDRILESHRKKILESKRDCSMAIESLAQQFGLNIDNCVFERLPNKANMELLQEEAVFLVKDLLQEERQKRLDAKELYITEKEKMQAEIQNLKNEIVMCKDILRTVRGE